MFDMKEWCKSLSNAIMTNYCDFKNISGQDLEELYKWIDIKKDIAEAEYYEAAKLKEMSIVEAMENSENEEFAGYNNRRYASGRYAPTGRGHYDGYRPYYGYEDDMVGGYMGYTDVPQPVNNQDKNRSRYGMSYDRYNESRRHYTQTKDIDSKKKMSDAASMVVNDMIDIMQDIWADLDNDEKAKHTQAIISAAQKY